MSLRESVEYAGKCAYQHANGLRDELAASMDPGLRDFVASFKRALDTIPEMKLVTELESQIALAKEEIAELQDMEGDDYHSWPMKLDDDA